MFAFMTRIFTELGLLPLYHSPRDTKLLCLQRFVRMFAYGASALFLVLFLEELGFSDSKVGLFLTLTLAGDTVISFILTIFADALGRKNILVIGSALMCMSGVIFGTVSSYWALLLGSIIGVISPSGSEIGPFRAIEESTLAHLSSKEHRSDIFAWYTMIGALGAAIGQVVTGWVIERLASRPGWDKTRAYRVIFWAYAFLGLVKMTLALCLSRAVESSAKKLRSEPATPPQEDDAERPLLADSREAAAASAKPPTAEPQTAVASDPPGDDAMSSTSPRRFAYLRSLLPAISPKSRSILVKLCLLFAVDSFASGLVTISWIGSFFTWRYAIAPGILGTLFFVTSLINAASTIVAASIARRIGPLKTMVFTHLPSSVFLALIPAPDSQWLAMAFLVLRCCTSSMDTAPRQAFLAAAVLDDERTAVMGGVNFVRTLAQTLAPTVTGGLKETGYFWIAFVLAGSLKASYDLGMLGMFWGFKGRDDEEQEQEQEQEEQT